MSNYKSKKMISVKREKNLNEIANSILLVVIMGIISAIFGHWTTIGLFMFAGLYSLQYVISVWWYSNHPE